MDDLSRFCCPNSGCPEHGKRDAGNLTVTGRYGTHKERRMFRCRTCKAHFAERKGTPLFDSRLPPGKIKSVLEHLAEGCVVRQTGRLCRVNRGTVGRLGKIAGEHARDFHDELVALSPRMRGVQFNKK
jgi:transposase-like protein